MRQRFVIKNGSTVILDSWNKVVSGSENIFEAQGWDGNPEVLIETAPKMVGNGSYILSKRLGNKEFTVNFNILNSHYTALRNLENLSLNFTELTFERSFYNNDTTTTASRVETLKGYITTFNSELYREKWGNLTILVLCTNPVKTIT